MNWLSHEMCCMGRNLQTLEAYADSVPPPSKRVFFYLQTDDIVVVMQDFSDADLVNKYLAGESKALEELVKRYLKQVFLFAKTYVKNNFEAEGVTQEVFVKAWKNLKKFDPNKKFKTWLFQITKNTCIDFLRKHKNLIASENIGQEQMDAELERLIDPEPLPQEIFDAAGLEQHLQNILNTLPEPQKLVVTLHLQQDLTFEEISQILNEPINTTKSRYRRALLDIRKNLN